MSRVLNCPGCGASLEVTSGMQSIDCSCGKKLTIRIAKNRKPAGPTPDSGTSSASEPGNEADLLQPLGDLSSAMSELPSGHELPSFASGNVSRLPMGRQTKAAPKQEKELPKKLSPLVIWASCGGAGLIVLIVVIVLLIRGNGSKPSGGEGTWEGSTYVVDQESVESGENVNVSFQPKVSDIKIKGTQETRISAHDPQPTTLIKGAQSLGFISGFNSELNLVTNYIPGSEKKSTGTVFWIRSKPETGETIAWQAITTHTKSDKRKYEVNAWLTSNPASISPSGNKLALIDYYHKSRLHFFVWKNDEKERRSFSSRKLFINHAPDKKIADTCWLDEETIVTKSSRSFSIWKVPEFDPRRRPSDGTISTPLSTIEHSGKSFLLKNHRMMAIVDSSTLDLVDLTQPDRTIKIPLVGKDVVQLTMSDDGSLVAYQGRDLVVVDLKSGKQTVLASQHSSDEEKSTFHQSVNGLAFHQDRLVVGSSPSLVVNFKTGAIEASSLSIKVHQGRGWKAHGSPKNRIYCSTLSSEDLSPGSLTLLPKIKNFRIEIDCFDAELSPKIGTAVKKLIQQHGGHIGDGELTVKVDVKLGDKGKFSAMGAKHTMKGTPPKIPSIDFELKVIDSNGEVCHKGKFSMTGSKSVRVRPGEVTWLTLSSEERNEIIAKLKKRVSELDTSTGFRHSASKFRRWLDDTL